MANGTALVKTIEHWERMIKWVTAQDPLKKPDYEVMKDAIGENWYGAYCPLCIQYKEDDGCKRCKLYYSQGEMSCSEEGTFWEGVAYSVTWAEWLQYAKQLLILLKRLERKEKINDKG